MKMDRKYKLVQKVPKTPRSAYNHGRFISSLIEHQLKHFNEVEKSLLKAGEKLTNVSKIKTELQASKYLKKMTARLHPQGAEKQQKIVRRKRITRAVRSKAKSKQVKRRRG
jgi:glycyl-tRNA synthetase alpha subunit